MSNTEKAIQTLKKTDFNSGLTSIKTSSPSHISEWVQIDLVILVDKLNAYIDQEANKIASSPESFEKFVSFENGI